MQAHTPSDRQLHGRIVPIIAAVLGSLAIVFAWMQLDKRVLNVVRYEFGTPPIAFSLGAYVPVALVVLSLAFLLARGLRTQAADVCNLHARRFFGVCPRVASMAFALGIAGIAAVWWAMGQANYLTAVLLVIFAGGLIAAIVELVVSDDGQSAAPRSVPPLILGLAIAASTLWHAATQYVFWQHFALGYADFGLYTRELAYCLPWEHFAERFGSSRMAFHFEPLIYALAPLYAVVRSPVFLMFVGPLALNLAAVAFYQLALARTGSRWAALVVGLCWLALPSLSRMPYAGSYGFESVHLAVPCVAFTLSCALRGKWTAAHIWLAAAMLCQETVCGVAIGWGVYLAIFTDRRRTGVAIAVIAVAYLLLATTIIIPHISPDSSYNRVAHFGQLTPAGIVERLRRPCDSYYLLALMAPLWLGLLRNPRLLLVALPTLGPILLLENTDYLSLKYWHQSTVLPVIFAAATLGMTQTVAEPRRTQWGPVLGTLAAVLLWHQLLGFSPLAQSYRVQLASEAMQTPDERMDAVRFVRQRFPYGSSRIVATERAAAHFVDYFAFDTAAGAIGRLNALSPDVIVVDEQDGWDPTVQNGELETLLSEAETLGYRQVFRFGSIRVLTRGDARLP